MSSIPSIVYPTHNSSIGNINANIIALLAYLIPVLLGGSPALKYVVWLAPLVMYFIEKDSGLVKFHAMQAFVLNLIGNAFNYLVSVVISGIFLLNPSIYSNNIGSLLTLGISGIISLMLGLITFGISAAVFILSIIAMIKAYKYSEFEIPFINLISDKIKQYLK